MSTTLSREFVAQDLRRALQDKLDPAQLDAVCRLTGETSRGYPASGQAAPCICVHIDMPGGRTFRAGPYPCEPIGQPSDGEVSTDDLALLYEATRSCQFVSTPVYLSIQFFDGSGNVLGTFQGAPASGPAGIGGGVGSWS
ncbi:virulence-associated protein [Nannocystis exedens]|uniref:Virulence-associated protein n=1 Tax=Nannocystis exedens TaxID=54 RepID=A0A1I2H678_9BACT|nr:VapA/VapB family virulence-associated protein [Nannocystis exedens]PCC73991.1 virulence associated protein VapA [Nannocystis exedens]SFF24873.1 virulence-associated protein [Nannocystis exedens]